MAKPYRSRSRLVLDVMRAMAREGDVPVTRLLMIANLSHPRLRDHIGALLSRGWAEERGDDDRRAWGLTDEGRRVLRRLEEIDSAMRDFGLVL